MATKTVTIYDNWNVNIPVHWTCNSPQAMSVNITWSEDKTSLIGAKLYLRVYSDTGYTYFDFWVNNQKIPLGEFSPKETKETETDILAFIRNGVNQFRADYCKSYFYPLSPNCWITAVLTLTYEGETPNVSPPRPPMEWYEPLIYAGLIIAGVFAVGYIIHALRSGGG